MTIPYLIVEILVDLLTVAVGIACMVHAADNLPRRCWGFVTLVMGATFVLENVGWLNIVRVTPQFRFESLLDLQEMMEFYAVATVVSFFPMASLHPGYLTLKRTLPFLIPPIIVITVGISYLAFNGQLTPLAHLSDVAANVHERDVQLRLVVFVFSVATPLACFYSPFLFRLRRNPHATSDDANSVEPTNVRRPNKTMWVFLAAIMVLVVVYIVFTLWINYVVFSLFGAVCVLTTLAFALLYLRHDNPFALPPELEAPTMAMPPVLQKVNDYMTRSERYVKADFSLDELSLATRHTTSDVSQAIKEAGFSGFREYVKYCRLTHFRHLATTHPEMSVKELMYASGFTSRSAFYRAFSGYYETTPSEFLQSLRGGEI